MESFYSYNKIVMQNKELENNVFLISVFPKFLRVILHFCRQCAGVAENVAF